MMGHSEARWAVVTRLSKQRSLLRAVVEMVQRTMAAYSRSFQASARAWWDSGERRELIARAHGEGIWRGHMERAHGPACRRESLVCPARSLKQERACPLSNLLYHCRTALCSESAHAPPPPAAPRRERKRLGGRRERR